MVITTVSSWAMALARSMPACTAWADSKAGIMPSTWDRVRNASSASVVGDGAILRPLDVLEQGVLRTDPRIVEPRGDAVRLLDHAVLVLEEIGLAALQHPDLAGGEGGRVHARFQTFPGRLRP